MKRSLFVILVFLWAALLQASEENALYWLESQSELHTQSSIATKQQVASETLQAFQVFQTSVDSTILRDLVNFYLNTTEVLVRKIALTEQNPLLKNQLLIELLKNQNENGGFGEQPGYNPTVLDTAFALQALTDTPLAATSAINYILEQQKSDGSWSDGKNEPSVYVTAIAMRSLWLYRKTSNVSIALESAKNFLLAKKATNHLWDEKYLSALALIAIAPTEQDNSVSLNSVDALYSLQSSNGSWDDDMYTTALILRALALASQKVPNPDLGSISGRVLSGDSGLALAGVKVKLIQNDTNRSTLTDTHGDFSLSALAEGDYTLEFSKDGFAHLQTHITFSGSSIDLGEILLNKSATSTTATIKGIVQDKTTLAPLANVSIAIGTQSTTTNAKGEYYLDNIAAGEQTIHFEIAGYLVEQKKLSIQAGYTVMYTALLTSVESIHSDVKAVTSGSIVDKDTLNYIEDVTVTLSKENDIVQTLSSDAHGYFQSMALGAGVYTIAFEKEGYRSVQGTFNVATTQSINFGVVQLQPFDPNEEVLNVIEGVITDAITKEPLNGALISVSGNTALSGADGSYKLESSDYGEMLISISKDNYVAIEQEVTLKSASRLIFSPAMLSLDQNSQRFYGTILDANTAEPLSDVNVTLSGATEASTFTDMNGNYLIDGLSNGEMTISLKKDGYQAIVLNTTVSGTNVEFSPSMQSLLANATTSTIKASVIDATTKQPLEGVNLFLNELLLANKSDTNGTFFIEDMNATELVLKLQYDGYKDIEILLALAQPQYLELGELQMRPITAEDLRPDLVAEMINTSSLVHDAQSLKVNGAIEILVANRGTVMAQAFETVAFFDTNADGNFTKGVDEVIARHRFEESLMPDALASVSLELDTVAHFRDQPIYVYVDSQNENIELSEKNNLYSTAKSCGGKQGNIDLGVCFDYSGSVSSYMHIQKNGLVSALRDPDKFPRDGSVRLTVYTGAYTPEEYLEPTIITESNADVIADKLQNSYFSGYDYMGRCLRTMADKWEAMEDKSSYRAITLSGDGHWGPSYGNINSYAVDRTYASEHGINVIDTIGIGNTHKNGLEAFAYPQPAGGDYGKVYYAKTSEDISNSLINTFQKQTEIADLTLGKLEIVDNGDDANISATMVIGNAGVATIPEGIEVAIYEGDPHNGGVHLKTVVLEDPIAPGEYRELRVDNIELQEGGELYVLGDATSTLVECSKNNNEITGLVQSTTTLGSLDVKSDKTVYGASEDVTLSALVKNPGRLSYALRASLKITDASGELVAQFALHDLGVLASGESVSISDVWNTATILSGNYLVKGYLYDTNGALVDASVATFSIISGDALDASLRVLSDKNIYNTTDEVELSNLVRNLTSNTILSATRLKLRVLDTQEEEIFRSERDLQDLAPQAQQNILLLVPLHGVLEGIYTVEGEIVDEDNKVLATATASFQVATQLEKSLGAQVFLGTSVLKQGEIQTCTDKLVNRGGIDLANVALRQAVLSYDKELLLASNELNIDLMGGEEVTLQAREYDTSVHQPGEYACILQIRNQDEWETIAYEAYTLQEPPIKIDYEIGVGAKGRMLILLDPPKDQKNCCKSCGKQIFSFCKQCFHKKDQTPDISKDEKHSYLEELLSQHGFSYTIVTDTDAFEDRFHSGQYDSYALLQKDQKLSEQLQKELREAVFIGDGLFVSNNHDHRNGRLDEILGIDYRGHVKKEGMDISESEYYPQGYYDLNLSDTKLRVKTVGAEVVGGFLFDGLPALTRHTYNKGDAVFAAFDLVTYAANTGNEYEDLLLKVFEDMQPNSFTPYGNTIYPISLTLSNQGIATVGQTKTLFYNAPISIIDSGKAQVNGSQELIWEYTLEKNASTALTFWIELPPSEQSVTLQTEIYTGDTNNLHFYDSFAHTIQTLPSVALEEILEKIEAENKHDYILVKLMLRKALFAYERGKLSLTIDCILQASSKLSKIKRPEAIGYREDLARTLKTLYKLN